eukprot:scaffold54260_cov68-Phaeocystis_antarctica.AAC.1
MAPRTARLQDVRAEYHRPRTTADYEAVQPSVQPNLQPESTARSTGTDVLGMRAADGHPPANLCHGQNNMTPEQQAISVALSRIQVAQTDIEVCKVARTLAYALGATRAEVGTIKALHAVLLQMTRPGMSDMEAVKSTKASNSNFVKWKRKVLMHAWAPVSAPCLPQAPTTTAVPGRDHPPLPATTPALPPTRAGPSAARAHCVTHCTTHAAL